MTEIINATRTEAYAQALGLTWVKDTGSSPALATLLGEAYTTPSLDTAPWYDPDSPESGNFAGLIPLDIGGIEDSTRDSTVFEYTTDGGNPGSLRHATKPVTFSVALIGTDECAVEYGFRWLKRALMKRNCAPGAVTSCRGENLYYAHCVPEIVHTTAGEEPATALFDGGPAAGGTPIVLTAGGPTDPFAFTVDGGDPSEVSATGTVTTTWSIDYERHLVNVLVNNGPTINRKKVLPGCGGVVWLVSFTAVAGNPFEWGNPVNVINGLGTGANPYVSPYTGAYGSTTYTAAGCPTVIFSPVYDPLLPALVAPPAPPNIAPQGFVPPSGTWQRRYAELPPSVIPEWDEVRPVVTIRANTTDARMVRVRFYPMTSAATNNCEAVGEFLISYLPHDVDFIVDAAQQAVYVSNAGTVQRADTLVYGSSDAKPIKWFGLSCGDGYRVTLDWANATTPSLDMDLALVPRTA